MKAEKTRRLLQMMTGDAYELPIQITLKNGIASDDAFKDVEVVIGNAIRKTLQNKEISYDKNEQVFYVKLTQDDTFKLRGKRDVDIRLLFANGEVFGVKAGTLEHEESQSRTVLE
jgi:hypothetical protein